MIKILGELGKDCYITIGDMKDVLLYNKNIMTPKRKKKIKNVPYYRQTLPAPGLAESMEWKWNKREEPEVYPHSCGCLIFAKGKEHILERTQPSQQMVLAEFQVNELRSTFFILHKNKTKINQRPSLNTWSPATART